jgi:hypothetical protein
MRVSAEYVKEVKKMYFFASSRNREGNETMQTRAARRIWLFQTRRAARSEDRNVLND